MILSVEKDDTREFLHIDTEVSRRRHGTLRCDEQRHVLHITTSPGRLRSTVARLQSLPRWPAQQVAASTRVRLLREPANTLQQWPISCEPKRCREARGSPSFQTQQAGVVKEACIEEQVRQCGDGGVVARADQIWKGPRRDAPAGPEPR